MVISRKNLLLQEPFAAGVLAVGLGTAFVLFRSVGALLAIVTYVGAGVMRGPPPLSSTSGKRRLIAVFGLWLGLPLVAIGVFYLAFDESSRLAVIRVLTGTALWPAAFDQAAAGLLSGDSPGRYAVTDGLGKQVILTLYVGYTVTGLVFCAATPFRVAYTSVPLPAQEKIVRGAGSLPVLLKVTAVVSAIVVILILFSNVFPDAASGQHLAPRVLGKVYAAWAILALCELIILAVINFHLRPGTGDPQ